MRLNAALTLGILAAATVPAATAAPVHWSVTAIETESANVILEVSAQEEPGVHIYALGDERLRPTSTLFQFDGGAKAFENSRDFASDGDNRSLKQSQRFLLVLPPTTETSLTFGVRYSACTKKVCYPPAHETIVIPSLADLKHVPLAERLRKDCRSTLQGQSIQNASTAGVSLQSSIERVSLVELYSSEGCSSCPPADRWLRSLRADAGLWKNFVPLEFHVDYWNYLGWRDPFSQAAFSARQRDYADAGKTSSVYTPGVFLSGREWRDWNVAKDLSQKGGPAGVLSATSSGQDHFTITFAPAQKELLKKRLVIHAAVLGNELHTQVASGENNGKSLEHDFVVLNHIKQSIQAAGTVFQTQLNLPVPAQPKTSSHSVAFWITEENNSDPIQALGGELATQTN